MSLATEWLTDFLSERNLENFDSRPIYAYRCSTAEFGKLSQALATTSIYSPGTNTSTLFAIYSSEWWRRHYDGGPWKWAPILESLNWNIPYNDLYEPLKRAWKKLGVQPIKLSQQVRYLGTCACQGGLPLQLIGHGSDAITRYLRALLRDYGTFHASIDRTYDLAEHLKHILPRTLRQDPVFEISAHLVEQVWEIRSHVVGVDDPTSVLDKVDSSWRDRLPVDLEDQAAITLVQSLLKEAAKPELSTGDEFELTRYLHTDGSKFSMSMDIRCPAVLPSASFARQIGLTNVPKRFELRIVGANARTIASGRTSGEEVYFRMHSKAQDWLADTEDEIRLQVVSGGPKGKSIVPKHAGALSGMPWTFIKRDQSSNTFELYSEGSMHTRLPAVMVACAKPDFEKIPALDHSKFELLGEVIGRVVIEVNAPIEIPTEAGLCRIAPSQDHELRSQFSLKGQRSFDLQTALPVFLRPPDIYEELESDHRKVASSELHWKSTNSDKWIPHPDGPGVWQVRYQSGGVTRFASKLCIMNSDFAVTLEPGDIPQQGAFVFEGIKGLAVAALDPNISLSVEATPNGTKLLFRGPKDPPAEVQVAIKFPNGTTTNAWLPFPGRGARFVHNKFADADLRHTLSVEKLFGWRVAIVSPNPNEQFHLVGELIARDLTIPMKRATYFKLSIPKIREHYSEMALVEAYSQMTALFAATKDIDAEVSLEICGTSPEPLEKTRVRRFGTDIEAEGNLFWVNDDQHSSGLEDRLCMFDLGDPASGLIPLTAKYSETAVRGWELPPEASTLGTVLVLAESEGVYDARPRIHVAENSLAVAPESVTKLAEAANVSSSAERLEAINQILRSMESDSDKTAQAENWEFISDLLINTEGIPVTTFDVLDSLVTNPVVLTRLLLTSPESLRHRIWHLEKELPFAWPLVPHRVWAKEFKILNHDIQETLVQFDAHTPQSARAESYGHINGLIAEAKEYVPSLTVLGEISCRTLRGISEATLLVAAQTNPKVFVQNLKTAYQEVLRVEDWPLGPAREDWAEELEITRHEFWSNFWFDESKGTGFRKPLVDGPIGAAFAASEGATMRPILVHSTKMMRELEPRWFDQAYVFTSYLVHGNMPELLEL